MTVSDYARATGAWMSTSSSYYGSSYYGNGYWWLRSPCLYSRRRARIVYYDGDVDGSYNVVDGNFGVVPALQIRLTENAQTER